MSSSTETRPERPGVLRGDLAAGLDSLHTPELRGGAWTRLGDGAVLGDAVTERALSGLAETTASAARAQGYSVGWAQGRREAAAAAATEAAEAAVRAEQAEVRRESEHAAALDALARAAAAFQRATTAVSAEVEDQALRLARELAAVIVGHELRTATDPAADTVRRALAVLPTGVPARVRLHPSVADAAAAAALATSGVTVVPDAGLAVHDAVVETADTVVDLAVDAALTRVVEALS